MGGYLPQTWDGREKPPAPPSAPAASWGMGWWYSSETATRVDNAVVLSSEDAAVRSAAAAKEEAHRKAEADRFLHESGFEIWLAEEFKTGLDNPYQMQRHQREFSRWLRTETDLARELRRRQRALDLGERYVAHDIEMKQTDWA